MKRNPVLAAALASALALAPATAHAEDASYPAAATDAQGTEYFLNQEGTHYVPERQLAQVAFGALSPQDREKAVEVTSAAVNGMVKAGETVAPSNASAPDARAAEITDAPATEVKQEEVFGPEHADPNSDAPVAAGLLALPPVLTVSGTTYYLNADGATYVTDVNRVGEAPTPEEISASQALLAENGAEVARQALEAARAGGQNVQYVATPNQAPAAQPAGEAAQEEQVEPASANLAATTERGMAAETGNNTVAKALFALAVASVIGAAAFAYGRRFLV